MKTLVAKKTVVRRVSAVGLAVLAAALLAPAAAGAASYVLRPTSTEALQSGWSASPSTSSADLVLNKAVTQPAAPDLSSFVSDTSGGTWTAVGVAAPPAFSAGETLSQTTAWAYVSTDATRPVTLSLWTGNPLSGYTNLGSTSVPGGASGGWYSVSTRAPLDATHLGQLVVAVQGGGSAGTARVFAAYAQMDTSAPAPLQPAAPPAAPAVELSNLHSDVSFVTPSVITVSPHQSDIPVELSCAAGAAGGCHGVLVLRALGGTSAARAASAGGGPRATASRCARGCRILGKQNFNIAAGRHQHVSVHLAHSARHLVHSHRSLKAQAVAVTTDGNGNTQITKTTVTLSQGSAGGSPSAPASPAPGA